VRHIATEISVSGKIQHQEAVQRENEKVTALINLAKLN
jgi:hypothetical protein